MSDTCMVCGGNRMRIWNTCRISGEDCPFLAGREMTLVRCRTCGFIFADPRPRFTDEETRRLYGPGYFRSFGVGAGENNEYRLKLLARYRRPGDLLEIGCGEGAFLRAARDAGWKVTGTDISPHAVEICRSGGIDVIPGTLETAGFNGASFDALVCADLLEHVEQPRRFLDRAAGLLRPGGVLYLSVPNIESLHYRAVSILCKVTHGNYFLLPYHLNHFSPRTLAAMCGAAGLTVAAMIRTQSSYPCAGWKGALVRGLYLAGMMTGRPDRLTAIAVKGQ